jgi:hypothetical protein
MIEATRNDALIRKYSDASVAVSHSRCRWSEIICSGAVGSQIRPRVESRACRTARQQADPSTAAEQRLNAKDNRDNQASED